MAWFDSLIDMIRHRDGEPRCPIRFDAAGWRRERIGVADRWSWTDDAGDTLVVSIVEEPAIACDGDVDIQAIRAACRAQASQAQAGIVQVDRITIAGAAGLLVLTKGRADRPQSYTGVIATTIGARHVEICVTAREHGTTGVREAMVSACMAESGELSFEPAPDGRPQRISGWFQDPYDDAFDREAVNAITDDERVDIVLPSHPISKIRATLRAILTTAALDPHIASNPAARPVRSAPAAPPRGRMPLRALGLLYMRANRLVEADAVVNASIAALEAAGEATGPTMVQQIFALGMIRKDLKRFDEALATLERAERVALATFGPTHTWMAIPITHQGFALLGLERPDDAETRFDRALEIFGSREPPSGMVALALYGVGMARNRQDRYEDAIAPLERALGIIEKEHGPDHRDGAGPWAQLALAWARLGDEARANDALARAESLLTPRG